MRSLVIAVLALFGCETYRDHSTRTHVPEPTGPALSSGVVRRYYISADEVDWDYAPQHENVITGKAFDSTANVFTRSGKNRVGHHYRKALYREYTDSTFRTVVARTERWEHLGMLGPVLRATVGDTFEIHFRNNTGRTISVHPHGVFYDKQNEGAPYQDGTNGESKLDDAVGPGALYVYRWAVPETAGPAPHDGSSVMWMYHSHTDEVSDTNSGLVGPMIVTAAGRARADGTPDDVDREFVTTFWITDENKSPYTPKSVIAGDEGYAESNLMHGINGYVYGNIPGLVMKRGERVRWYLMAMGSESDLHSPHWHGNTVIIMGMRTDVAWLLPATMAVADMRPAAVGTWLFHCHVNDHLEAGMTGLYTVTDH
jgi:manganese oxidase